MIFLFPQFIYSQRVGEKNFCNQSEWAGVDFCFDDWFPIEVESKILPLVLNELSALPPPSSPLNSAQPFWMKIKLFRASFQDLSLFLHPSKKKRNNEEEKGLGMMPGMTLFLFKKVGHWLYLVTSWSFYLAATAEDFCKWRKE